MHRLQPVEYEIVGLLLLVDNEDDDEFDGCGVLKIIN